MQRREMDRRQNPPRSDHEDDELQKPEDPPSFLTARELQAREPAKEQPDGEAVGERRTLKERRRNPG